jgi:probable phosphoglycerate mutase
LILLIRHGQTDFNAEGRLQGRLDSRLTPLGIEQAGRMAERLRPFVQAHPDVRLICSPSLRTRETARIVCESLGHGGEIAIEPRIAEVDVGRWEGFTREDLEREAPGVYGSPGWLCRGPGGESYEALAARLGDWLAEIDEADGARRLVVSHGIAGRVLRHLYAREPESALWTTSPPPQDAVFRLHGGLVEMLADDKGEAGR